MSNLKTKFLYQLTTSVLHALLPLITFPYVTRILGPERLGAINFVDYTAQIFITLANFGIPLYAVREIAKVRESPRELQKVVSELLSIHLLTTFIGLVAFILTIYLSHTDGVGNFLIVLASLNILINAFSLNWFVHGLEDFKALTLRSLIIKFLVAMIIFLFIKEVQDYKKYYTILVGGSLLIVVFDIYYLKKRNVSFSFSSHIKKHIHPLFIFFLTSASITLYTLFDTFILGILTSTLAVGFYTTALKIIRLFQSFINSLAGVLLPRIAYLIAQKNEVEISHILNKSFLYVFTISVPAGFLFFLLAPEIILVLVGDAYLPSITTIQILSLLPLFIGLSNIFGIQVLIPYGQEKSLLKSALIGGSVSIILCILLSPIFKEDGAAIATIITELIVTLIMGIYASRLIQLNIPSKSLLNISITSILFTPIIIGVRLLFNEDIWVLLISLMVCIMVFFFIQLYIFSNSILKEMMNFVQTFKLKLLQSK